MTRDDIIRMAREAKLLGEVNGWDVWYPDELEHFAQLVAAAKAKELAEELRKMPLNDTASSIAIWIREQE